MKSLPLQYVPTCMNRELVIDSFVSVHFYEYTADFRYEGESHDFWEMIYCDRGSLDIVAGEQCLTLQRGDLFLHPCNQYHNVASGGGESANSIIFSFTSGSSCLSEIADRILHADSDVTDLLFTVVREAKASFSAPLGVLHEPMLVRREKSELFASEQMLQCAAEMLLLRLCRIYGPYSHGDNEAETILRVRRSQLTESMCAYLTEHLSESITFSDLVEKFSSSPTTVKTLFRTQIGCGAMEYLQAQRLERAKELLRNGEHSVTEIAALCGFCSIHHFSRIFRQKFGLSPTAYVHSVKCLLES